jgi:hypothetical protein
MGGSYVFNHAQMSNARYMRDLLPVVRYPQLPRDELIRRALAHREDLRNEAEEAAAAKKSKAEEAAAAKKSKKATKVGSRSRARQEPASAAGEASAEASSSSPGVVRNPRARARADIHSSLRSSVPP